MKSAGRADAVDLLVDVRAAPAGVDHPLPHGLQGSRPELDGRRLAVEFPQRPEGELELLEFLVAPIRDGTVVALGVVPEAGEQFFEGDLLGIGGQAPAGSHPLGDSRGQGDGEAMSLDDALDGIGRITAAVDVPVSADMESGYDTPAAELVERVLAAGAVGINIEDTVHSQKRMRSVAEHADYIGALRAAADAAGVALVINARTDAFLGKAQTFDDPLAEAITRLRACEEAGARCAYPVKAPDAAAVRTLLAELNGPINVISHPVNGSAAGGLDELRVLGVHRVSFGPFLQATLTNSITDIVTPWAP